MRDPDPRLQPASRSCAHRNVYGLRESNVRESSRSRRPFARSVLERQKSDKWNPELRDPKSAFTLCSLSENCHVGCLLVV